MNTGLVVASDDPAAVAAAARDHDYRPLRWPEDGLQLIEQHWDRIGPCLDALTEQTGVRRLGPDEAAALPGVSTIAVMLTLLGDADRQQSVVLVAEPGALTSLVSTVSNLTYGQRRVLPMPLDILASMNRKLRGVAAMSSALSVSGAVLSQLRTRGRWAAVADVAAQRGQRAARHLALAGIAVLPETDLSTALAEGPSRPADPWLHVERCEAGYELLVRVPWLERDSMVLSRAGDDLIVTVDGLAHPIELPSGLKRCAVIGGSVTGAGLHIRFQPERGKWHD